MLAMSVLFTIFTHWVAFVLGVALTLRLLVFNNPRRNTTTAENELQSRIEPMVAAIYHPERSQRALLNLTTPETYWMNWGLWEDDTDSPAAFAEACERLCYCVAEVAGLGDNDTVLDAGFGCGDQVLLWLKEYKVAAVMGVDISSAQVAVANARLAAAGYGGRVVLRQGSATRLPWDDGTFTQAVSVDSAYHYATREDFFIEAHRVLKRKGKLTLADICLGPREQTTVVTLALKAAGAVFSVPYDNMVTAAEYTRQLQGAGFADVKLEDVSADVFSGFAAFLSAHQARFGAFTPTLVWLPFRLAAYMMSAAWRAGVIRFIIVTATKP